MLGCITVYEMELCVNSMRREYSARWTYRLLAIGIRKNEVPCMSRDIPPFPLGLGFVFYVSCLDFYVYSSVMISFCLLNGVFQDIASLMSQPILIV